MDCQIPAAPGPLGAAEPTGGPAGLWAALLRARAGQPLGKQHCNEGRSALRKKRDTCGVSLSPVSPSPPPAGPAGVPACCGVSALGRRSRFLRGSWDGEVLRNDGDVLPPSGRWRAGPTSPVWDDTPVTCVRLLLGAAGSVSNVSLTGVPGQHAHAPGVPPCLHVPSTSSPPAGDKAHFLDV